MVSVVVVVVIVKRERWGRAKDSEGMEWFGLDHQEEEHLSLLEEVGRGN
jgi:hypothetical protein